MNTIQSREGAGSQHVNADKKLFNRDLYLQRFIMIKCHSQLPFPPKIETQTDLILKKYYLDAEPNVSLPQITHL